MKNEEPKIVSYSRDKKGKIENYHLNEVANTIHGGTGSNCNTAQYVLEPKPIVEMNKYPSNHACGKVYNVGGGVSPTVMYNHGETVSIADPFVVASRGRPKGGQGEYGVKFETKMDVTSNALTRSTRLNLVAEPSNEPNVLTPKRTEYGKKVRKDWESHKLIQQRKFMQNYEPRIDGVSNTLTSVQKDNLLVEPVRVKANTQKGYEEVGEYGAVNISRPGSTTRRGRVQGDKGDIVGTLTTVEENAVVEPLAPIQRCRIRRLTPRECFRLQDVSEEDIDKIQNYKYPYMKRGKRKHISNSQQYKLAGNSIPVACMFYIFKNLFSSPVEKVADAASVQLDIFDII